jgi:hypothetical protein
VNEDVGGVNRVHPVSDHLLDVGRLGDGLRPLVLRGSSTFDAIAINLPRSCLLISPMIIEPQ